MKAWRSDYELTFGSLTPAVKLLLLVNIAIRVVQWMLMQQGIDVNQWFGLSLHGLLRLRVWQIVTYMFLHGPWYHLLLNMLVLFMMGPETERAMGHRQFYVLYFVSGILGGVGWLIISAVETPHLPCIGASGAVFGIIGAFAALFPQRHITLLLFFVLPVTMKAWVLALVLGGLELVFLLTHALGGVANAAHLGGGIAGYVYAYTVFREGAAAWGRPVAPSPRRRKLPPFTHSEIDMKEVDRILDKIEREGMQSLTRSERDLLHKKSRQMRG